MQLHHDTEDLPCTPPLSPELDEQILDEPEN